MVSEPANVIAIVPMKPLAQGKSRLSQTLSADQRADLALGMLRRVVLAIKAASVYTIWVVGGDDRVRVMTCDLGAESMDELGKDLNDTLKKAFELAFEQGKSALYVAGDLPFLKAADIHSMMQASRSQGNVTLAPARRDGGTNSILVPLGVPMQPELGQGSFMKHLTQAARLETSVAINSSYGLGFDLDVVDDLETFQHMEPGLLERLSNESKKDLQL
ncbi:MAG: 2-phospho-L-lactate guanylyltransferase [Chloroflexi bacterium]|jgi:2-phospho-L-lactate guanylyltransferase|nr:2-phospho-L-lactate guanylyltransferase [Chloroflexota bacterium]MDP6498333.1 2-phospho-L-lactate guanylyltransferase [Dehalococcoidia bacterium]MQG55817.1 2-phospho-L-lactate guanylyltransferase [SAR202 cluster bacterium]|tara:strand:+ start:67 stop:720 length:654 start_codon:yes stop_codon:yes gene_type:complete